MQVAQKIAEIPAVNDKGIQHGLPRSGADQVHLLVPLFQQLQIDSNTSGLLCGQFPAKLSGSDRYGLF
jgi:hypothetical protein